MGYWGRLIGVLFFLICSFSWANDHAGNMNLGDTTPFTHPNIFENRQVPDSLLPQGSSGLGPNGAQSRPMPREPGASRPEISSGVSQGAKPSQPGTQPPPPPLPFGNGSAVGAQVAASKGLVAANHGGNPGFMYQVQQRGSTAGCQGTLVGKCKVATAVHCLTTAFNESPTQRFDNDLQAYVATATITMADFGTVNATMYLNPNYFRKPSSEDTALFTFQCTDTKSVPILPLYGGALQEGQRVKYGKVMAGKAGYYQGQIYREPNVIGINGLPVGEAQESVLQNWGPPIQQGDSGGPLTVEVNGTTYLAGVLSTGDDITRNRAIGNYSTRRSMGFIQRLLNQTP